MAYDTSLRQPPVYRTNIPPRPVVEDPQVAAMKQKFAQACAYFDEHDEWPTETDPELGGFIKIVNRQFQRQRHNQRPAFGKDGYTEQLHSDLRKRKYEATRNGRNSKRSAFQQEAEESLMRGDELTPRLANRLRELWSTGQMTLEMKKRFEALFESHNVRF